MAKGNCKICGATSEETVFYARVNSRCAECHKAKVKENRAAKVDHYRSYDATRFQKDPRVRARHEKYRSSDAGKESLRKAREKWRLENPEKRAAHIILGNRVKCGNVQKPDICEACSKSGCRIEGHHHDYSKPLDVKWLCSKCHSDLHKDYRP